MTEQGSAPVQPKPWGKSLGRDWSSTLLAASTKRPHQPMLRRITEDEVFTWWIECCDELTLEEARPAYETYLENVREVLRDFWGR